MGTSERRVTILDAAARLFEHYGHSKTTMADVAREAQVGVGTVYLEFASKEAIVEELSRSTHVGVIAAMREAAKGDRNEAVRLAAVLAARTEAFLELRRKGQHACELLHCTKTEGVRAAKERFREEEHTLFVELLEQGWTSGRLARVEANATAKLLQKAFACLSPPSIFADDEDAVATSARMCELLLRGLLARPVLPRTAKKTRGR